MSELAEPSAWEQVKAEAMKEPERDEVVDLINWIENNPGKTAALLRNIEESELIDRGNRRTGTITQFLDDLRDSEII